MSDTTYYILILLVVVLISFIFGFYLRGKISYTDNALHKLWLRMRYTSSEIENEVGAGIGALEKRNLNKKKETISKYPIE